MKHKIECETLCGKKISVWDSGESTGDRYTVLDIDSIEYDWLDGYAMDENPNSPNGIAINFRMPVKNVKLYSMGGVFKNKIRFSDLPVKCQTAARNWIFDRITDVPIDQGEITYRCAVCGERPVDAENGFDTCEDCKGKQ